MARQYRKHISMLLCGVSQGSVLGQFVCIVFRLVISLCTIKLSITSMLVTYNSRFHLNVNRSLGFVCGHRFNQQVNSSQEVLIQKIDSQDRFIWSALDHRYFNH